MLFITNFLLLQSLGGFVGGALVSSAPTYLQMLFLKTNFYVGALETSAPPESPPNMLITKLNYI